MPDDPADPTEDASRADDTIATTVGGSALSFHLRRRVQEQRYAPEVPW
jgi:hypothetical protein